MEGLIDFLEMMDLTYGLTPGWLMRSLAPIRHPPALTLHPIWLLIAAEGQGGDSAGWWWWGGAHRRLLTESSPPLCLSVAGSLHHDWSDGIHYSMKGISGLHHRSIKISNTGSQTVQMLPCLFWDGKGRTITHQGGPRRTPSCQHNLWILIEIIFDDLVLTCSKKDPWPSQADKCLKSISMDQIKDRK